MSDLKVKVPEKVFKEFPEVDFGMASQLRSFGWQRKARYLW